MAFKKNLFRGRGLVIVAHPDDETIWCGGIFRRYPAVSWTIFSLCRASDPDRQPKFLRACRHYQASPLIADLPDDDKLKARKLIALIKNIVSQELKKLGQFDLVFTHGANGEYGHTMHQATHRAIKALYQDKKLAAATLFCFNYSQDSRPRAKANSDFLLRLTAEEFKEKKALMTRIYGFAPDGIDANYCTNPEAFKIIKLNRET